MPATQVVPGRTYLITRGTKDREFLLRPENTTNSILSFCLFSSAEKFKIKIHAFVFMSNHYHILATDHKGNLPDFMHMLNLNSAKCLNVNHGRRGSIWDPQAKYSRVLVEGVDTVWDKLVYLIANPLRARLVYKPELWPGLISLPEDIGGKTYKFKRPEVFFSENSDAPEMVEGKLSLPPELNHLSEKEFQNTLQAKVNQEVHEIHSEMRWNGQKVLGVKKVLAAKITDRPKGPRPPREINPKIACKDKKRRMELIEEEKEFQKEYEVARIKFQNGDRNVLFPAGTYLLKVKFNVRCSKYIA